jgi:hypothetical protein
VALSESSQIADPAKIPPQGEYLECAAVKLENYKFIHYWKGISCAHGKEVISYTQMITQALFYRFVY